MACFLFVGCQSDKSDLSSTASRAAIGDKKDNLNKGASEHVQEGLSDQLPRCVTLPEIAKRSAIFFRASTTGQVQMGFHSIRKPSFNWSIGRRNGLGDQRLLWFQTALKLAHSSLCWIKAAKLSSRF